jgi:peptidoglycan/LPS O-acetylase OafA/YrhL
VYFVLDRAGMTFGCPWMLGLHDGRDGVLALLGAPAALASCLQPSNTWDRALGAASYPLYLVQKFVDVFFEQWLRGASMLIKSASLPLQWLTMLVVTVVLYRYFDRPVDGWRQAWVTRRLRHET